MTGPDAILVWILLGCIAVLSILAALIGVAASLADGASDDDGSEQSGALEGAWASHNETGK